MARPGGMRRFSTSMPRSMERTMAQSHLCSDICTSFSIVNAFVYERGGAFVKRIATACREHMTCPLPSARELSAFRTDWRRASARGGGEGGEHAGRQDAPGVRECSC